MLKYAMLAVLAATAFAADTPPEQEQENTVVEPTWTEVIQCYKNPQTANGCMESRMSRALLSLRDTAVGMARSDPETLTEDVTGMSALVQQIGELISYSISSYFRGEENETTVASSAGTSTANEPVGLDEGRGHHKKKKIQKEIKKFVLKILLGIFLLKQKIKMIIMTIQSILMSKFLIVAMIYAISNTFKIWYDIKQSKYHKHDKVVYYENAHHQHHYEPPEHSDYEDHHDHGWGGEWGRSIAVTEPSINSHHGLSMSQNSGNRYIRRISRTSEPTVNAQNMAFNAQLPSQ